MTTPPTPGVNLTDAQRGTALYRTAEARRYLRSLVFTSPQVSSSAEVLTVETVLGEDPRRGDLETLLLDLSDGTTISLAIRRFVR